MQKQIEKKPCKNCIHYQFCVDTFRKAKQAGEELIEEEAYFADAGNCDYYADERIYRKQEWVSVEERLPECENGAETEALLFITRAGMVEAGYFGRGSVWRDVYFRHYRNTGGWDVSDVTHWMPLPSAPKGE